MTAHRRLRGRAFNRPITEFGECVWYYKPNKAKRGKLELRWAKGIFLGIREESGEIIVGTDSGCLKARAFRRRGSEEERWNKEEILNVKGAPWQPVPGGPGIELRSSVELPSVPVERTSVEIQERPFKERRFKITKKDLREQGLTIGCEGCDATLRGAVRNHNEACRDRLSQALGAAGDPRILAEAESHLEDNPVDHEISEEVPMEEIDETDQGMDDGMSVGGDELGDVGNALLEITANSKIAKHFSRWDKGVQLQWGGGSRQWNDGVADMEHRLDKLDIHSHVSEIYSPPRVTGLAEEMGLVRGMALDLSVPDPDDGKPWDFNDPSKRSKALKLVVSTRTLLFIAFSYTHLTLPTTN